MEGCTRLERKRVAQADAKSLLWPLLKHLVFICNGQTGFYTDGLLVTASASPPVKAKTSYASPTHRLVCKKKRLNWRISRNSCFDKAIRQPFKQVFRGSSTFPPSEGGSSTIHRYTPAARLTAENSAVLKDSLGSRLWGRTSKIYYKREYHCQYLHPVAQLVLACRHRLHRLEYVCFLQPKGYKPWISEIPPVVFCSEMWGM